MALNPQFPNYANGPAGTEVIAWTVVGGQPLYRLPVAYVDTGFGAAYVCEGSTLEAPTYPEGVYEPDPVWDSAGTISGVAQVGQTLTFTPGTASGTAPITETYNWIRYVPGGQSVIVGTGLNYSPVTADLTHDLVVQSVATNTNGSVATQTVPYGPVTPSAPVISDAGVITSVPSNSPTSVIYPTQLAVYSGPTVTGYSPQVSWVWGFGTGADFSPFQLGGTEYRVQPGDVNKEIFVRVYATNTGGTVEAYSTGIEVQGSAPTPVVLPRIGPQEVVVGDTVTGKQGTWAGYPRPQVIDWGFAEFLIPTPAPIPEANKTYTYKIPQSQDGNRLCFYVTAENSEGTVTSYSLPTDAVYDELKPTTLPFLTGFQSPAQYGDVLKGTPGGFDPSGAYQYSYFAHLNNDGSLTEIAGTRGTTTYTIGTPDLGKQIVYASYGENTGKYGQETLTTQSNSTGVIRRFAKVLTPGTITFSGDAPLISSTCQCVAGTTDPALVPNMPGPTLTTLQIGYLLDDTVPVYFEEVTAGWTSPYSFTVPVEADGWSLFFDWTAHYDDSPSTSAEIQIIGAQRVGLTPPAEGVKPYQTSEGDWAPGTLFNPGQTLTWVPGTYAGVPTPLVTWTWQRRLPNGDTIMLQNGGLTYTLPDNSAGWKINILEIARNAAGIIADGYPDQTVGGPLPVFTRLPVITGSNLLTPTSPTTLNCITPLARDPISGQDIPVTWQWMVQYGAAAPVPLGHPFTTYTFYNENGRWTGGQIFIQGSATNSIGTVTCESNRVNMLGTPRILSTGVAYGSILPNRLQFTPGTFDGGGSAVTNYWEVEVVSGNPTGGFFYPAVTGSVLGRGTGTISGVQKCTNAQGETSVDIPTSQYTWP